MSNKTYNNLGLYNSYDKKHKERDALDYYATPSEEVLNILQRLDIDFHNKIILKQQKTKMREHPCFLLFFLIIFQ